MALACIGGRADIMLHSIRPHPRVIADGGTYSAHPATMRVAYEVLDYLARHEQEIYPRLTTLTRQLKEGLRSILKEYDIPAVVTGGPEGSIPDFPIGTI